MADATAVQPNSCGRLAFLDKDTVARFYLTRSAVNGIECVPMIGLATIANVDFDFGSSQLSRNVP